ncbi:gamma-glutamyltranspeptidase 1-like, partial [Silurus asotus]
MQADLEFSSRRSPVICLNGCVASSQPLASNIGLEILKRGGNAADAAVAVAAALNVTEPTSTGLGGDAFCLFYDAKTKQVRGLNGSGRSPKALTLDLMRRYGFSQSNPPSKFHAFNVTVPGAAACWCDTVTLFGSKKLSLADLLQPAIDLAQNGFPVAEITAYHWADGIKSLRAAGRELGADLLINNQPPKHGQIMTNHNLAHTFQVRRIPWVQFICDIRHQGLNRALLDCNNDSKVMLCKGFHTDYRKLAIHGNACQSSGINYVLIYQGHNSAEYLHILAESLKLSLTDTMHFSTDPEKVKVPVEGLLSKDYAFQRAHFIQMDKARSVCEPGIPTGSDTVYFSVVDREGNGCSFVNSNYMGFGTGLVPPNCGFSLQNRGANFSLDSNHVNCIGSEKRPYHTIIPAMLTDPVSGHLLCSFGVMGGFMQPQGHVQVLLNMIEFGMNPQRALDAPRLFVQYDQAAKEWALNLEAGLDQNVADKLRERGHVVKWPVEGHERNQFGRGQIISKGKWWWDSNNEKTERDERVLWAGSDPRADGCAVGY